MSKYNYLCPKCGGHEFNIEYTAWAKLTGNEGLEGTDHVEPEEGGVEYDDDTEAGCVVGDWRGTLGDARIAAELAAKPKLKLIDMAKLPKGTMVETGDHVTGEHVYEVMMTHRDGTLGCWNVSHQTIHRHTSELRIAKQKEFTYWDGGDCPVPEGVRVEVALRDGLPIFVVETHEFRWTHFGTPDDIIGYRIVGVAKGWTDDPELAK